MRFVLPLLLLLSGCSMMPNRRHIAVSPAVSVSSAGVVEMTGDAQSPTKVDTKKTDSKLPLPEGSRLEFNERLGVFSITLSKPSELSLNRSETAIQGPVAFTPDRGPTVGEEGQARADFWTVLGLRVGMAGGAALAIFGLVRRWDFVMYGGAAISGACLFGLFVQQHPILLLIIGLGATLAFVGPLIWHTKLKKLPQPDATRP
jgi:hypothetical protein